MQLSLDQLRLVEHDVQIEGITYSHLEYDLLDHVCCDIEDRMRTGFSFDDAYQAVKQEVEIQGLRRVQEETLLLINKNYRMMKKSMKTLGTIALAGISVAALAKIMHWPFASFTLLLSTFMVSTIFFPSVLYVWYKEMFQKKNGFVVILAFFAGFTFMYGTLFRVMHWPFSSILLILGELLTILTIIIGGITYLLSKQSEKYPKGLLITGIIGIVGFSLGTLFKLQHWPFASILLLIGAILLFCIFLPVYAYHSYKKEKAIKNSFIFSIYAFTFIITFTFLLTIKSPVTIFEGFIYRNIALNNSIAIVEENLNEINESNNSVGVIQVGNKLYNSITKIKEELIIVAGGTETAINQLKLKDVNQLNFKNINFHKDFTINESNNNLITVIEDNDRASILYHDIQEYKSLLIKSFDKNSISTDFVNEVFRFKQDNAQDWINENFYNVLLIASLNNLTQLQLDIRLTQHEAIAGNSNTIAEIIEENTQK
ncbi:MAG: hypothetical protein GQ564_02260 [Bacteroidales bacterium]|nr:hypothetical protein [Bacteroidales bacterium]